MVEQTVDASGLIAKAAQIQQQAQAETQAQFQQQLVQAQAADAAQPAMQGALPAPPGFVGALAHFIYHAAPRPVPEVAIVGALGIMAGIAGREWHISNTGLNLYVVLVARSGIGKEAMHSGISMFSNAASAQCHDFGNAFDFSDYASGPALTKGVSNNPCMVNVAGEIGHKFLAMAKDNDPGMRSLRKVLTNLYTKSGPNGIAGGISYSSQENNVESMRSVAFSLIGESTPGTFFESITPAMMDDGFMSRFCVIEYPGDRPNKNPAQWTRPPEELVNQAVAIMTQAVRLRMSNQFAPVSVTPEAQQLLDTFEAECDHAIRAGGDNEGLRQIWNRAHLKVLRVSALLAVGENPFASVVTLAQVQWAIGLVRWGNATFERRIRSGEVGEGTDGGREAKVMELCREFLSLPADKMPAWLKDGVQMRDAGIVPRKYLQQRTQRIAAFEKFNLGHTAALNMAIKTAVTNGNLMDVGKDKLVDMHGFFGQAYRVLSLT